MARRKKHRKHSNPARYHRRHHRKASRRHRRYHRNPVSGPMRDALMTGLAVVAAVAVVKKGGNALRPYIPASLPQPDLIAEVVVGVVAGLAARKLLRGSHQVGALGGIAGAILLTAASKTPVGQYLSFWQAPAALPAPGQPGMGASLEAALEAELSDADSTDY